jgi:N-acetylglucosaminyldiphosphoundecaprenol N-acetyl-beta-D-mannosaminyltransferase
MSITQTFPPPTVNILGIPVSTVDRWQLLAAVRAAATTHKRCLVLSGNVYSCNLAYEHEWFRAYYQQADLVHVDGAGLRLGARLLGRSLPTRITWADFIWELAAEMEEISASLFLIGSEAGVAEKAAARLQEKHPRLNIVGCAHGYFDKTPGSAENGQVVAQINALRPNVLLVGFGMPLQEGWLVNNWEQLEVDAGLTVGALFAYLSGELTRAPKWMTDNGLEWLGRLLVEPRRLWQRYLVGNPLFLYRVLRQRYDGRRVVE